jgi:putative transposase
MPRQPCAIHPNVPLHLIQQCNILQARFFYDSDYQAYLDWLSNYAKQSDYTIHHYLLRTNHVHLLLIPKNR